jgi:hypothetical protein
MKWLQLGIISLTLLGAWARPDYKDIGRSFSLFSVVQFPNDECTTLETKVKGTCKSADECRSTNGVSSGNCASGFGVCCYNRIEIAAGATANIIYNGTYVQSPKFPTGTTVAGVYTYNVKPNASEGICQIRIDLDTAVFANTDTNGICATDTSVVTTATFNPTTTICGTLTGQHLYIETGKAAAAATITIKTTGTATTRMWKYRVRTIECDSVMLPSNGCLQYFTGVGGDIVSLNGNHATTPSMITNLNYNICFRQEAGYCEIQLTETDPLDVTAPDSFHLDAPTTATLNDCTATCLLIDGWRYGGQKLSSFDLEAVSGPVNILDKPFRIGVFTTGNQATGSLFKLTYSQTACQRGHSK